MTRATARRVGSNVNLGITLAITVDRDDWDLAYGASDSVADIREHVKQLVEEAVMIRLGQVANGARLVGEL